VRRILAVFLLALLLALALGVLLPRPLLPPGEAGPERILLLAGPIHTDIALPLDAQTRDRFGFLAEAGVPIGRSGGVWLVVGWGGRAFYLETPTWADLRPGPTFRAVTWDDSVLHVDVAGPILLPQEGVLALDLTAEARERLELAILATFEDRSAIAGAGYGATDRFFEAAGGFNLLLGCNTWTGAMLREAGLRTGAWTPLPRTLLWSLRLHADVALGGSL
jgi:uncharacterized protein (TIGR02117 family)